jgi:LysR family transcriptional regulator, low CO2-responsive transcriptional regulator
LTLHQVRIFNAIAKHLSITKAARELRVSQPSISKQLRLLEEERGIKLHTRSGQGINLTEEGRKFWDHSQRILYQIVGATESPSASLVPDTLKDLRQHHAQVQFILRTGDSRAVEQMLMRSEVEVGIITYPSHCAGIVVETLCSSDVTAVVPSRHPLAVKSRLSEDELSKAPFIIKSNGRIEALLRQKRLNLRIVMRCESGEAVRGAVEAGLGVGLLYRENVEHGLKDGYLKSLHIPWLKEVRFNWFIVHRSGVPLSANAKAFVALLRKRRA